MVEENTGNRKGTQQQEKREGMYKVLVVHHSICGTSQSNHTLNLLRVGDLSSSPTLD